MHKQMHTQVHWIEIKAPGSLGVMSRPRGGDWLAEEVSALARCGVTMIVSALEPAEVKELEIAEEPALATAAGLSFLSVPIPDRGVPPDSTAASTATDRIASTLLSGGRVVVHCRQGIGRAGLIACAVLTRLGYTIPEAIAAVSKARGRDVPETDEQKRWLQSHCHPSRPA